MHDARAVCTNYTVFGTCSMCRLDLFTTPVFLLSEEPLLLLPVDPVDTSSKHITSLVGDTQVMLAVKLTVLLFNQFIIHLMLTTTKLESRRFR